MIQRFALVILIIVVLVATGRSQSSRPLTSEDLSQIVGTWFGNLTYLDYTSGKPFSMPANARVTLKKGEGRLAIVEKLYPKEPKANSIDTLLISSDGRLFNGDTVRSVSSLKDGGVEVRTEARGVDGNDHKPASFRMTYTLSAKRFAIRKEVKFDGEKDWLLRHEYTFTQGSTK